MAFFGLFDKKICAICGGEIGLLGNRKLEDGNCCKNCAAKLSPWFDERRHSTVEQIKEQLAYREENLKAVENFHTTRTIACDRWNVQLAAFSSKKNASIFAADAQAAGIRHLAYQTTQSGIVRVIIKDLPTEKVQATLNALERKGYKNYLVRERKE